MRVHEGLTPCSWGRWEAACTTPSPRPLGGPKHPPGWSTRRRADPGPTGASAAGRLRSPNPGTTGAEVVGRRQAPARHATPRARRLGRPAHEPLRQHERVEPTHRPHPLVASPHGTRQRAGGRAPRGPVGRGWSGTAAPPRRRRAPRCGSANRRMGRDTAGAGQPAACRSRSAPRGRGSPRRRGGLPASCERSAPPARPASWRDSGADVAPPHGLRVVNIAARPTGRRRSGQRGRRPSGRRRCGSAAQRASVLALGLGSACARRWTDGLRVVPPRSLRASRSAASRSLAARLRSGRCGRWSLGRSSPPRWRRRRGRAAWTPGRGAAGSVERGSA